MIAMEKGVEQHVATTDPQLWLINTSAGIISTYGIIRH